MPREYRLERKQLIARPLEEVFAFFADAANLQAITPAWLDFQFLTPLPIEMKPGAMIDYQIRLLGVPLRWRTRIESFEPGVRFVDTQVKGPYALWHHTHEFFAVPSGVEMIDRVRYALPLGPLGPLSHALFVKRWLGQIFDYRRETIERRFAVADSHRADSSEFSGKDAAALG